MKILIKQIMLGDKPKDILIENGVFSQISDNTSIVCDKTIDGHGKAVFPAFYNGHTHAAMTLLRGYGEDLKLFDWLNKIWKQEAKLTEEDIYNGTRLAILEMIKSGTVFFADMYWHHSAVIRAVKEMKIRANVGITFMDSLSEKAVRENIDFVKNFESESNPLIQLGICPHAIYTCGSRMYTDCFELAERYGLKLHTHLAETKSEFDSSLRNNGCSPVAYLDSLGMFEYGGGGFHCVHMTEEDLRIFQKRGLSVVTNPGSNTKLASGIAPIRRMMELGINIGIGTDGPASNNCLDMFREMFLTTGLAKLREKDAAVVDAGQVLYMATAGGAKACGLNECDALAEGKLADLIMTDLHQPNMQPLNNIAKNLVYSGSKQNVKLTMVNGRILYENGEFFVGEDPEYIYEKANQIIRRCREEA